MDLHDVLFYTLEYSDSVNSMPVHEAELHQQEPNYFKCPLYTVSDPKLFLILTTPTPK